jgi:hypothetical protein
MDYASAIWGTKKYSKCETVQNRAMRIFLGVGKVTPVVAMYGDLAWIPPFIRHQVSSVKLWHRLCSMESDRITRKVFNMDYTRNKGWCADVKRILMDSDLETMFTNRDVTPFTTDGLAAWVEKKLMDKYINSWKTSLVNYSRLDIYSNVKDSYTQEGYLCQCNNRLYRTTIAKLRMGTFHFGWKGVDIDIFLGKREYARTVI